MGKVKSCARTPPAKSIHPSVPRFELRESGWIVAGSNSNSVRRTKNEALVLESPLSGSSSMNSLATEAVILIQLAPISFDEDGFETTSGWLYRSLPADFCCCCCCFR